MHIRIIDFITNSPEEIGGAKGEEEMIREQKE